MTKFNVGDTVEFGARNTHSLGYRKGYGVRKHIPTYKGLVLSVSDKVVQVDCPKYSNKALDFTLRKSGNWVQRGEQEDGSPISTMRGENGSRVALRKIAPPTAKDLALMFPGFDPRVLEFDEDEMGTA